ncbi:MAG: EAL domain-containing protein [Pseudomonadota bacterium]
MGNDFTGIFESITGSFPDRPPLVLIVDDEATIRLMTRRFLEHAGFIVLDADNAEEGKRHVERSHPDIILLDVDMPGMNGFQLTAWIRQQPKMRYTPIVMITGREDSESVNAAYDVGATDFIVKPISWSVLAYRVRYILRSAQTQLALRESHSRVKAIVEALPDRLFLLNQNSEVIGDNVALSTYTGVPAGTVSLQTEAWDAADHVLRQEVETACRQHIKAVLKNDTPEETAISLLDKFGKRQHFEVRLVRQSDRNVLAVVRDVTEQREATDRIHQLAYYDALTGLPNRQFFSSELGQCMEQARTTQSRFALLYIDLDHFKRINDTLGHGTGDELLKMVALRLERCLRAEDTLSRVDRGLARNGNIARLGGDEFTLLVRDEKAVDNIEHVATRIIEALKTPFEFTGHEFVVTPSIGIAIYPNDGEDEETLLKTADVAMYQAKQAGRSGFSFCTETTSVRSLERLDLEIDLRRALEQNQFELHYQPKVRVGDWRITGAEALLRWKHPERGWISPARIIPIAEDTGLIVPIGRWIIQEACRQMAEWSASGRRSVPVSVNLSSQQFWQDDVASVVEAALGTYDIAADRLELELTEGVLMQNVQQTRDALQTLKQIGIALAIDDFGTGYSSLAYLRQFPIDSLKIDRSFVCDIPDEDAVAICNAIISMASSLKLKTVAEGVESYSQLEYLMRRNCDEIQGYYFSKPLPAKELGELLNDTGRFVEVVNSDHAAMVAAKASAI